MAIDFRKARKGKRVAIVDPKANDISEVYIGSAYLPFKDKGVIVFTEYPVDEKLHSAELEYVLEFNSVIIWFNSLKSIENFEKHLARIKTHYEQNSVSSSRG